ncbi:MAG: fibronectin type III domain-containing protein [Luteitalea sp.]
MLTLLRPLAGLLLGGAALVAPSVVVPAQTPAVATVAAVEPGKRPSRVVLTWRDDPARSQAVTWRTEVSVDEAFAELAEASANPGFGALARRAPARTTPVTSGTVTAYYHEARFTALRPDTLYAYRVGDGAIWSEWFHFRTAALEPAPFSFIYLGDAQNDIRSLWSRAIRSAFMDAPRARFVVHAGDLVNTGESDEQWGEWFGAGSWLNAMVPQVPAVGNHEYGRIERDAPRQLSEFWRPQFALPEDGPQGLSETVYSFDFQGVRMIVLNSEEPSRFDDQATWLEGRLKDNKNRWTIVAFHQPVFSVAVGRDNAALRQAWKPLFDKYGVDLVLQGHDHTYGRGEPSPDGQTRRDDGATVYVVSVSGPKTYEVGGAETWATRTGSHVQLYQVITISPQALRFEARTVTGQLFDAFELTKNRSGRRRLLDRKPDLWSAY